MFIFSVVSLFVLVTIASAYSTFDTTCTFPSSEINFVSAPNARGTLQILWSSLFTLLACTWTVLCLNVPQYYRKPRLKESPPWWGYIVFAGVYVWWLIQKYWKAAEWFAITLLAPEFTMAKYWDDLAIAKSLMDLSAEGKRLKKKPPPGNSGSAAAACEACQSDQRILEEKAKRIHDTLAELHWDLDHIAYANMGGFALDYTPPNSGTVSDSASPNAAREGSSSPLTGAAQGSKKKSCLLTSEINPSASKLKGLWTYSKSMYDRDHALYYLNARDIIKLCELKGIGANSQQNHQPTNEKRNLDTIVSKLRIEPAEITDRSKSDLLMRLIAVGQIIWVVIQVIARAVRHLAVTQLEVAVVAFALCAVMMYWLNRHKPKGVGLPVLIPCNYPDADIQRMLEVEESTDSTTKPSTHPCTCTCPQNLRQRPKTYGPTWSARFRRIFLEFHSQGGRNRRRPVRNGFTLDDAAAGRSDFRSQFADVSLIVGGAVFGGVHLAAWRFAFPTHIEQILWRAAAAWCAFFFPYVAVQFFCVDTFYRRLLAPVLERLFRFFDKHGSEDILLASVPKVLKDVRRPFMPGSPTNKNSEPNVKPETQEDNQATADSAYSKEVQPSGSSAVRVSLETDLEAGYQADKEGTHGSQSDWRVDLLLEWSFFCWTVIHLAVYVVARLFIIVEMFRALAYLPPDAYYGTWGSNLPGFD
ncbi:hypothetical protein ASPCADRAFT_11159 [Aspergillus carbonarius ITEM 5010]|uniref:Uncharacterized protein n=1 Tax=Aspergillus carbonarius (strain ITEM 5010) TaxID=602072 RepID=A0A1R3R608_ASPC5|nr:hypothetical protein ASPCADRAFT_11159 [Aspergillus carbonarius ITEM 5010]